MTLLELYHADRSTCSQKVRICLAELGLQYRSRPINLIAGEQLTPAYLAINPNGVVPALVHDDAVIIESTVICEYLCEAFPGASGSSRAVRSNGPTCAPGCVSSMRYRRWPCAYPHSRMRSFPFIGA